MNTDVCNIKSIIIPNSVRLVDQTILNNNPLDCVRLPKDCVVNWYGIKRSLSYLIPADKDIIIKNYGCSCVTINKSVMQLLLDPIDKGFNQSEIACYYNIGIKTKDCEYYEKFKTLER